MTVDKAAAVHNQSPCLVCKDRYPGCHPKCEPYLKWRKLRHEELQDRYKKRATEHELDDLVIKGQEKRRRAKKGGGRR